ncbi:MAG: hypothetical protein IJA74_02345 [Oscillospiraceae bacterium]|nr:hypothetical protein [Oscillospiraceae bacterium]
MKKFLGIMLVLALALSGVLITSAVTLTSSSDIASLFPEGSVSVEGNTITLLRDINALAEGVEPDPEYLPYDEAIVFDGGTHVLDMNGHGLYTQMADYDYGFIVKNGANVTIQNSNDAFPSLGGSIMVEEGATLTLDSLFVDGDFYNYGTATLNETGIGYFPTNSGTLTINGGYCNGGLYTDGGKVYINGGDFNGIAQEGGEMYITDCVTSSGTGGLYINGDFAEKTVISGGIYNPCYWEDEPDMYTEAVMIGITAPAGTVFEADYIEQYVADGYRVIYDGFEFRDVGIDDATGNLNYCLFYRSVKVVPTPEKYSDVMKKITTTETWTVCADAPEDSGDSEFLLSAIAKSLVKDNQYEVWAYCNEEPFNPNRAMISLTDRNTGTEEIYYVDVKYTQPDAEIKKNVDAMVKRMKDASTDEWKFYILDDLYLVNYAATVAKTGVDDPGTALNFAKEFLDDVGGGKFTFGIDTRLGSGGGIFYSEAGGHMIVMYDGDVYATTEGGIAYKFMLYVPADTANTPEAYMAAAQKRIDDYFGADSGISLAVGGLFSELDPELMEYAEEYIDFTNAGDSFYMLKVGEVECPFVIAKSESAENFTEPSYKGGDLMSKIEITTTDKSVPLDTEVMVEEVKNDAIKNAVGTDTYAAYDITLYSGTLGANITKLDKGVFTVKLPIPAELADKDLTVFYVPDEGEPEEHAVITTDDGYVIFDTDHFSTYVLTEVKADTDSGISSPQTADSSNMFLWSAVMVVAAAGFVSVMICDKKRKTA